MMIHRALLLAAISAFSVAANANIVNGSFELGSYTGSAFQTLGSGATDITGWIASDVDWINTYWNSQDGSKSIDLNATSPGSISQTFATTAGLDYIVEYYVSGNSDGPPTVKTLDVTADGTTFSDSFDTTGSSVPGLIWAKRTFTFTADDSSATLKFASTTSGSFGAAIDNVTVQAVPEPATLAVLSVGLVALKRRRNRS